MKKAIVLSITAGALALGVGCIMINSSTEYELDGISYRSPKMNLRHSSSNSVGMTSTSEGGGKLDATLPVVGK